MKLQRRIPAVRARHGKRLPQHLLVGAGDDNISGPFTFTVTETHIVLPTLSPVSTLTVGPPLSSDSSTPSLSLTSTISSPVPLTTTSSTLSITTQQATSSVLIPSPSASVTTNNESGNDTAQLSTSGPAVPKGAIAGIILGVILIFLVGIVIAIRKHSLSGRLKLRGWASRRPPSPSFLWIEHGEKSKVTPYSKGLPVHTPRDTPAAVPFGTAGTMPPMNAPSPVARIPPMPARPSRTQGEYNSSIPPTPSAFSNQAPENAIVVSTFIPTLPDELSIVSMETIRILSVYDDGWAYCSNVRGETGMVPLECLARRGVPPDVRAFTRRSRTSSLALSPGVGAGRF